MSAAQDGTPAGDGGADGHELPAGDAAGAATAGARAPGEGSAMGQLVGEDFSLAEAVGGVRGFVEAVAPGLVFVVAYLLSGELVVPLVASLAVALVATLARLVARTPVTQALGGLVGVLVGVVWAWRSGEAEDYFALGLWTNAAYAAGLLISVLARWPVVGVVVALLRNEGFTWRTGPALRGTYRRYRLATWLWVALFVARLAVQLPLYLQAEVAWLGTARLVMGVPLWALTLWATWVLVRRPAHAPAR